MFVNLRGLEALTEMLGAQALPQITDWVNRYFVEAQETLAGCGGLITQIDPASKGFTLLCPFGAPLADEETPHRATAAALRLNEKLRALNQELQAELQEQAPGQANTFSVITPPTIRLLTKNPATVTVAMAALGKACSRTTFFQGTPFAMAVRMYG